MSQIGSSSTYTYTHTFDGSELCATCGYKFVNGNEVDNSIMENVYRNITVPDSDTTLDVVCYCSSCDSPSESACVSPVSTNVTLSVIDKSKYLGSISFKSDFDVFTVHEGIEADVDTAIVWAYTYENVSAGIYEWHTVNTEGVPQTSTLFFAVDDNGNITGDTTYIVDAFPVTFTITNNDDYYDNLYIHLYKPNRGDILCESNSNNVCGQIIYLEPGTIEWKPYGLNSNSNAMEDITSLSGNSSSIDFELNSDGLYDEAYTQYEISELGNYVTNQIYFQVDMTEWLDEPGYNGMPIFSVIRNDSLKLRWNTNLMNTTIMEKSENSNIYSALIAIDGWSGASYEYKYYLQHSVTSQTILEAGYGTMLENMDWGWEDSPRRGGGKYRATVCI